MVHYWRKHRKYPIARAFIKQNIRSAIDLASPDAKKLLTAEEKQRCAKAKRLFNLSEAEKKKMEELVAGTSAADKVEIWNEAAKLISVCIDPSESETRKNFESIFCLFNGERLDEKREIRLIDNYKTAVPEDVFFKLTALRPIL